MTALTEQNSADRFLLCHFVQQLHKIQKVQGRKAFVVRLTVEGSEEDNSDGVSDVYRMRDMYLIV